MAQAKIKGSTDWPMASNKPNFTSDENGGIPATLVIHEEKHEEVFTASEVKAKDEDLNWALKWINNEARHLRERGEPQEALEVALDMILERHGIVLDPA